MYRVNFNFVTYNSVHFHYSSFRKTIYVKVHTMCIRFRVSIIICIYIEFNCYNKHYILIKHTYFINKKQSSNYKPCTIVHE